MKSIEEFLQDFNKLDIYITISDGDLKIKAPKDVLNNERISQIKERKSEIINFLKEFSLATHDNKEQIKSVSRDNKFYPLSFAQQRLWFLDQWKEINSTYNINGCFKITGDVNFNFLEKSFKEIIKRHEILRTTFVSKNGTPSQIINDDIEFSAQQLEIQDITVEEQEKLVSQLAQQEFKYKFNLETGPLLRVTLLKLNQNVYVLIITIHHIICDGWSMKLLIKELSTIYNSFITEKSLLLPSLQIQYIDYAIWQRNWLVGDNLNKQLDYWENKLKGCTNLLSLPTDHIRPKIQTFNGRKETFFINKELSNELVKLSKDYNVTLFMTLLAVFKILFYRYTNQTDILIGTPIANRNQKDIESLVGYFVNTLVLRTELSSNITFKDFLNRIKKTTIEAYTNQDVPFEYLVEKLHPERNLSYSPFFQVMFALQNYPVEKFSLSGLTISQMELEHTTSKFDINLAIYETNDGLKGELEYNTDLFEQKTILKLIKHYNKLLEEVIKKSNDKICELSLLTEQEKQYFIKECNTKICNFPDNTCLHHLIEQQAKITPNKCAIVHNNKSITYKELNEKANQLAYCLIDKGVKKESLVGICISRSIEQIIAIIGILKAGGAYVPIDPDYPKDFKVFLKRDTGIKIIILNQLNTEDWLNNDIETINFEKGFNYMSKYKTENINININSKNIAYLIYTSGSTGSRKGVVVTHKNVISMLYAFNNIAPMEKSLSGTLITSFTFDVSVWEIFSNLCFSGTLHIMDPDLFTIADKFVNYIHDNNINSTYIPPFLLSDIAEKFENKSLPLHLKRMLVGVEPIKQKVLQRFRNLSNQLYIINGYGPTETTICCTFYKFDTSVNPEKITPIGTSLPNYEVYIVDENLELVPTGIPGEILVGGMGLTRGYHKRPELTAGRFIPNPFNRTPGARLYKTGDYAKYLDDGNIEFLNRKDFQIKIRGYRIELGEIESVLESNEEIKQSVVIVKETENNNKQLVAYIVPTKAEQIRVEEVREYVTQKLPSYMAPSIYVILDEMPLTPNSKIDRKKLPDPVEYGISTTKEYVGAQTETQIKLSEIWTNLLGLKQVSINDNFFEIGGHSLLATQLISRIRDVFLFDISLQKIFELPNILDLSKYLDSIKQDDANKNNYDIQVYPRTQDLELSFSQERLWFLDQLEQFSGAYNISSAMKLEGNISVPILEKSLNEIIKRHEVLRTTFITKNNKPIQIVHNELLLSIPVIVLTKMNKEEQEKQIKQIIHEETSYHFDLSTGPLLRVIVVNLNETQNILIITMHHIIVDGWSLGLLIKELSIIYNAFLKNKPSPLCDLPVQYADYAIWQRGWIKGEISEKQMNYWKEKLTGSPTVIELPLDKTRLKIQGYKGKREIFKIEKWKTEKIKQLSNTNNVTLFMTLLTIFKILLYRYSNQTDIVVGTPVANRKHSKIESLVGFFVNTLVLRTEVSGEISFKELVERVKKTTIEAYNNQDMPFEQIVEKVQPERSLSYSPLFQVMFILQNQRMEEFSLEGIEISQLESEHITSKFDITLTFSETEKGLIGNLEYNTDIFEESTIKRIMKHYERILESVINKPEERIDQIKLLSKEEEEEIIGKQSGETVEYPKDKCIHNMFEEQVERTPDRIAVEYKEEKLTYKELNERSNQLAHYLQENGVGPDVAVGLYTERSLEMVIGLLGILKAGGAYVPLDPLFPKDRLSYIINETKMSIIVTNKNGEDDLLKNKKVIYLSNEKENTQKWKTQNLNKRIKTNHLAYIIFTSGSTGNPKGVRINHNSLTNFLVSMKEKPGIKSEDRLLAITTISFDIAALEIYLPLITGSGLIVASRETVVDGNLLSKRIKESKITIMQATPSSWQMLLESDWEGDSKFKALCGGEALSKGLAEKLLKKCGSLWNMYGPTETTIWSSIYEVKKERNEVNNEVLVSIGKPINNTQFYVLDKNLQMVPYGVIGELYIGGEGISKGYYNRVEMTAEKFIPDLYGKSSGKCLYKTGDYVKLLENGEMEFLGRMDHQVKIRGYRIELGEIESVLESNEEIKQSVVIVKATENNNKQLVAYIVPTKAKQIRVEEVREYVTQKLPSYMAPSIYVILDEMPLTPNSKIDRKKLPDPVEYGISTTKEYVGAQTETQIKLSEIWTNLLGLKQVSINDNFFEIGGHSFLATQLISRVHNEFDIKIPFNIIFQFPTVEALSNYIDKYKNGEIIETKFDNFDLNKEIQLNEDLVFPVNFKFESNIKNILVTGANGFLGVFLLHELLNNTKVNIYCLVRAKNNSEAKEKVIKSIKSYSLWEDKFDSRIIPVVGELSKPNLGISVEEYNNLINCIDKIYHNGAFVNFVYPYSKLKSVNVTGTENVLKFASEGKVKPIHYISTLSIFTSSLYTKKKEIFENDPLFNFPDINNNGYSISKWVADKIMLTASNKGFPITIYRLPRITGHSISGEANLDDFFSRMIKGCIQLKSVPDFDLSIDMTPVDYVSKAIVHISEKEQSINKVFHLLNHNTISLKEFINHIKMKDFKIDVLPYRQWRLKLIQDITKAEENFLYPLMPIFTEDIKFKDKKIYFDDNNSKKILKDTEIRNPKDMLNLIDTYFSYFKKKGFL
jgi:amino acid adenylation domain-containing protein/thioester reductase-like protein